MPDLDKGQHGRVPIVLERSLADVQYSVRPLVQRAYILNDAVHSDHCPVVLEIGE